MKKIVLFAVAALLGVFLLDGCTKVAPTTVNYKYSATVRGSVEYDNGNPAAGFEVAISLGGAPQSKYHAVTDSDGKFSITIPCLGKAGLSGVTANVTNFVYKGKKYSATKAASAGGDVKPGESSPNLALTLNAGVSVE